MIKKIIIATITLAALTGCTTSTTSELATSEVSRYGFSNISPQREMLGNCLRRYGIQYYKETGTELVYLNGYPVFDYCKTLVQRTDFGVAG
tara:strand:+ start:210 stop:482 length:273 start_codon:yes stop_codon:yes gene_type:complete